MNKDQWGRTIDSIELRLSEVDSKSAKRADDAAFFEVTLHRLNELERRQSLSEKNSEQLQHSVLELSRLVETASARLGLLETKVAGSLTVIGIFDTS